MGRGLKVHNSDDEEMPNNAAVAAMAAGRYEFARRILQAAIKPSNGQTHPPKLAPGRAKYPVKEDSRRSPAASPDIKTNPFMMN